MTSQQALEEENRGLRADNRRLQASESFLLAENARMKARITLLDAKVDALCRRLFGAKSEKMNDAQLLLALELPGAGVTPPPPGPEPEPGEPKGRRKFRRKERWPSDLPVEERTLIPEDVEKQPEAYREIGREVSEQLDYQPPKFFLRRTVRPTFVRKGEGSDEAPVTAPLPPRAVERGIAGPGLLAAIIVGKYCDHLPLYRQQVIFESRHGVFLSRQNMANWMVQAAFWMQPVYDLIRREVFTGGYTQIDETPIRYLDPGGGKTGRGYLWTAHRPGVDTIYQWETGRGADCLERLVPADFRETLQCDAYSAYDAFARGRERITLVACLAHIRRKFFEARQESPRVAHWFIHQIRLLYRIEGQLRDANAPPALRQVARASQSAMIYHRLARALHRFAARYLPAGAMGKAIGYALSNWAALRPWLEDGRIEIDNNLVENAIRPTAIGKKNWLFIGSADAGQTSAILFTIAECCRRREIDPFEYFRDVLERIPSMTNHQVGELTPEAWAKARRPVLKAAA